MIEINLTSTESVKPVEIPLRHLDHESKTPTHGSPYSAGYDLYAQVGDEPLVIWQGDTRLVHTGISIALPNWCFGAIFARSGLAKCKGLRPANCVGVIDSDYRGEIMVALHNDSQERQEIRTGDRIAQLVVIPFLPISFVEVDSLEETDRGIGGFGSTGV